MGEKSLWLILGESLAEKGQNKPVGFNLTPSRISHMFLYKIGNLINDLNYSSKF